MFGRIRQLAALTAAFASSFVAVDEAQSHLSIIRQGAESNGYAEAGDSFGSAFAYGDFNGDGYDDLATGSPEEDGGGFLDTGAVIINWGSEHGLTHEGARLLLPGVFGVPLNAGQRFGHALAAADFNRDGYSDLVIGVPGENVGGAIKGGRYYVFAGGPNELQAWFGYGQDNLGGTPQSNEYFGASLAVDDFNDDGYLDIAAGAPGRGLIAGSVMVVYGVDTGPFGTVTETHAVDLGLDYQVDDYFGYALATGNVMGDDKPDLIVGSPYRDATTSYLAAGSIHVLPGTGAGVDENQGITRYNNLVGGLSGRSGFGFAVASTPSFPYDNVVVGEPGRTIGAQDFAGRVVVAAGAASGPIVGSGYEITQADLGDTIESQDYFGSSISVGHFEDDPFVDIAIGSPGENLGASSCGIVQVALGGSGPYGTNGWYGYSQGIIGEYNEGGDEMGFAVSLGGQYDDTEEGTLVVGVPGEDAHVGSVHVIAPWRQSYFQSHQTAAVLSCAGDLVFSQKPFEHVFIASTTKIMTVLLACERSQLPTSHPDYVSLDAVYEVPSWVETDVGGSTADLIEDEALTLRDLMYLALHISANDAAHAIGDLLHGSAGPWESIPPFITEMNTRALELGMTETRFNNANGFEQEVVGPDMGDHYSTAYDMALLTRAALQNDLFREISLTTSYTAMRWRGSDGVFMHNFGSFQNWILTSPTMEGLGVKGGWTPAAKTTYCAAARGLFGDAVATVFGEPDVQNIWMADLNNLLGIGLNACDSIIREYNPWSYAFEYVQEGIFADVNRPYGFSARTYGLDGIQMDLFRGAGDPEDFAANVRLKRDSEFELEANDTIPFEVSPFQAHEGLTITSREDHVAKVRVITPSFNQFINLHPDVPVTIPADSAPNESFQWTITSHDGGDGPIHLEVREVYSYESSAPADSNAEPVFSASVQKDPRTINGMTWLEVDWLNNGGEYILVAHEPGSVASTPAPEFDVPDGQIVQPFPASPNPFEAETAIRFRLSESADVSVAIHDAQGRRVRVFDPTPRAAGQWSLEWNGKDDRGAGVAPGVYFYQVLADGRPQGGGKVTKLR